MNIQLSESEKVKIFNSDCLYFIMQKILLRECKIDRDREHFWVVGLMNNNRILFIELVSMGTVNYAPVDPTEVFSFALQKRAVKIIVVHNHPSGDLTPSDEDKDITNKLIQVGRIVNTQVYDHLIISERSYLSFLDIGLLDELKRSSKYLSEYQIEANIKKQAMEIAKEKIGREKLKIAKTMKDEGEGIQRILKFTGLSIGEIEKIKTRKRINPK